MNSWVIKRERIDLRNERDEEEIEGLLYEINNKFLTPKIPYLGYKRRGNIGDDRNLESKKKKGK